MGLNKELVGKDYGEITYEVTPESIEKYARATNDDNEIYFSENAVASPVFPFVPAFGKLAEAGLDPELQADVMRLVHGEEEHVLHAPIRVGDTLTLRTTLEAVESKDSGETFTLKTVVTNQNGEQVADVFTNSFIRGSGGGGSKAPAEAQEAPEIVYEESVKVDQDQTVRYAEASGDTNPIHVDEEFAKMVGLPGIILHGMCTMAFAGKAAVKGLAGGDPTRIKRIAVRFSKPVLPGQELTTKFWEIGKSEGRTTYGFETYNPDGQAVIKNGQLELE